jgi:hydroxymethylglutaryl-CoA synthase
VSVGIERLAAYVPATALPLELLARARGVAPEKLADGLGVREMAIMPPCEDVVTMAATAGARVLRAANVDPASIGMLLVATESAVDHAKPVGIFVHELLGVGRSCRVYELKHACYAGTAALMIAADVARYGLGTPGEPTQGAGAVAMLVGPEPRALVLGDESGTYADNVYDFWRPLGRREALVDGKYSVACYLDALAGAFRAYRALECPALGPDEPLTERLGALLYHSPFPKMAVKAHRRLIELDWRAAPGRWAAVEAELEAHAADSYRALVAQGLADVARVGNMYTASLWFCLASLLEREGRRLAGRRLGLFSYGSGCCAEFFTGTVPADAGAELQSGIDALLGARTMVDVAEYERLMTAGDAGGEPTPGFAGDFVFQGVRQDRRLYGRSGAALAA